jgi:hypothetical protein
MVKTLKRGGVGHTGKAPTNIKGKSKQSLTTAVAVRAAELRRMIPASPPPSEPSSRPQTPPPPPPAATKEEQRQAKLARLQGRFESYGGPKNKESSEFGGRSRKTKRKTRRHRK